MTDAADNQRHVLLGRVQGIYGVKGWVKIFSYTEPRKNILDYSPWLVKLNNQWQEMKIESGRLQGKRVVAKIEGIDDPDAATALLNAEISVPRERLPEPGENEFYWTDLEGMRVIDQGENDLGVVDHIIATGANDVLVVRGEKETLIPFLLETAIKSVDFENGLIRVDWDVE